MGARGVVVVIVVVAIAAIVAASTSIKSVCMESAGTSTDAGDRKQWACSKNLAVFVCLDGGSETGLGKGLGWTLKGRSLKSGMKPL